MLLYIHILTIPTCTNIVALNQAIWTNIQIDRYIDTDTFKYISHMQIDTHTNTHTHTSIITILS